LLSDRVLNARLENRHVGSFREIDEDWVRGTQACIILREARPKIAGLHADDRVHARIEGLAAVENFRAKGILF
jgi:hypothetical protein